MSLPCVCVIYNQLRTKGIQLEHLPHNRLSSWAYVSPLVRAHPEMAYKEEVGMCVCVCVSGEASTGGDGQRMFKGKRGEEHPTTQ
jgi:hypothetical protein